MPAPNGEVPEWLKGADCKSAAFRFVGSNPTLSTTFLISFHRGVEQLVARRAHNPKVIGSNPVPAIWSLGVGVITPPCHGGDHRSESGRDRNGSIAQLVEQRIEAPCVGGSIPSRAILEA